MCCQMASAFNRMDFVAKRRKNYAGLQVGENIGKIIVVVLQR